MSVMRWKALKYVATGLGFAVVGINIFRHIGISKTSITVVSYLFPLMALLLVLYEDFDFSSLDSSPLGKIVVVSEGEAIKMKRLITGEKYEIKGEVEKVQ